MENSTQKIDDFFEQIKNTVPSDAKVCVEGGSSSETDEKVIEKEPISSAGINEMNNFFDKRYAIYEKVLSPELKANEALKRTHKTDLMQNLFKILKVQFGFMYGFITLFLIYICASNWLNISDDVIFKIITFIEFYITSIIVELISILFFIVKNVFDKSIFDLFKNFDTKDTDKK